LNWLRDVYGKARPYSTSVQRAKLSFVVAFADQDAIAGFLDAADARG
jgi:hypothetical protein